KELEEQIDEAREKKDKRRPAPLRPAAGQATPTPAAAQPPPTPPPTSGPAPSRPSGGYPPSSEALRGATVPMPAYGAPKAEPAPPTRGQRNLGGTEFMAQSPFAPPSSSGPQSALGQRATASGLPAPGAGTVAMPPNLGPEGPKSPRGGFVPPRES